MVTFDIDKGLVVLRLLFPRPSGNSRTGPQHLQRGPLARDHRPLDDTLQLAHVAGPVVVLEGVQGVFRHGLDLLSCFLIEFGDKIIDKKRDVFLALPERRDRDGENIEPVEQVFPESALPDLFLQIPVGGRDDPHIDLDGFGAAQPLKLAVLDDPEQLGLKIHRHLADLVEKQGAVVGKFGSAPICRASEPVNAPFSRPKSSLSMRLAGSAVQLTVTIGRSLWALLL